LRRIYKLGVLFLVFALVQACTTQKKRGDLSALGKAYHNTTAHYNGYFNANELLIESVYQLEQQHQDNYNKRLPLFEYVAADNAQSVTPDLDKAIEKVGLVVNQHRYSQWTDDCYLLLGKAQFLKKEYETAEETFQFSAVEFSPENVRKAEKKASKGKKGKQKKGVSSKKKKSSSSKKAKSSKSSKSKKLSDEKKRKQANRAVKKKKKGRGKSTKKPSSKKAPVKEKTDTKLVEVPKSPVPEKKPDSSLISIAEESDEKAKNDGKTGPLKHQSAHQEIQLWYAKTLIERDKYLEAQRLLKSLDENTAILKDVQRDLPVVQAHLHLKLKNLPLAANYLQKAIDLEKNRALKARYAFVMGQIHQEIGNGEAAYMAFGEALKFSPDYEMQFSSKLKMAQNEWISGKGSPEDAIATLESMLRDQKNSEFKDQIYYALAGIALKQGDRPAAMEYLSQSLASNLANTAQKAEAYYQLGNLFFENQDYVEASAYFDSTLQVLPKTDDRYKEVENKAYSLKDIADNIKLIVLNDSLLRVAEMTEEEKRTLAYEMKKAEEERLRREKEAREKDTVKPRGAGPIGRPKESSFFAYNDKSVKRGKREFQRKWGGRNLEDDWRRANRQTTGVEETLDFEAEVVSTLTQEEVDRILGNVPKTQGEKNALILANKKAMSTLGTLYRERLKDNKKTVDILEELNRRYPGNVFELESWYVLYLAYTDLGNQPKAKEYFDKIIEKYPTTNYAKMLTDPDFAAKYLDKEMQENLKFDQAYVLFSQGRYADAIQQSQDNLKSIFGKHPLKPKYALLMAICSGNTEGKETYVNNLKSLIATYPNTEEEKRAKEILRILGVRGATLPGGVSEEGGTYDFEFKDKALHYVIIVFNEDIKLNQQKIVVSDYNRKYHKLDKIRISNVFLGEKNDTPVLVLRRFKDKEKVMEYYNGIQKNIGEFIDSGIDYDVLPISQDNYRRVLKNKSVEGYGSFFQLNYLD
jgi:tetratricopeptide (TPR) repeat protein